MCHIPTLSEQGVISDPRGLQEHIYSFYRELLGEQGELRSLALSPDMWAMVGRVSDEENKELMLTFSEKDLDEVLAMMWPRRRRCSPISERHHAAEDRPDYPV